MAMVNVAASVGGSLLEFDKIHRGIWQNLSWKMGAVMVSHVHSSVWCVRLYRIECRKAFVCLTQHATASGSQTPPSYCSSTKKICSKRRLRSRRWLYAFQNTLVSIVYGLCLMLSFNWPDSLYVLLIVIYYANWKQSCVQYMHKNGLFIMSIHTLPSMGSCQLI